MAEVHVVGTILGASGFPSTALCCRWSVVAGDDWKLLEGDCEGQTQLDCPLDGSFTVWSHPIDLHYSTKSLVGWPKLQFQVYHQDSFGRNELYGYSFVHIPTSPGTHVLEAVSWRPVGSLTDQLWSFFVGASPALRNSEIITSPADRYRINTVSMGKISLELSVITRNFESFNVLL